jgi:hypothetical protein
MPPPEPPQVHDDGEPIPRHRGTRASTIPGTGFIGGETDDMPQGQVCDFVVVKNRRVLILLLNQITDARNFQTPWHPDDVTHLQRSATTGGNVSQSQVRGLLVFG